MSQINRRRFLQGSLAAAATITIAGTKSSGQVIGANDIIRVGVAGLNGRGESHVGAFSEMDNVQVAYLIDPDTRTFDRRIRQATQNGRPRPETVQDVRRALDDRNVDVISIATPNHWHALMTIWACQAGKDVYVEKPCSHNVHEGRIAVETARRNRRIVQHGTQSRSSHAWANVVELIRSGRYGRLLVSRGLCYKRRDNSNGMVPSVQRVQAPRELDFNLWLGPAPQRPYHESLVHYRWHWFWDFGNGDIGNQGVHQMDIARWGIPNGTLPRSVVALGGRFGPQDRGETPNTQIAVFDYGENQPQLIFEVRGLRSSLYEGEDIGNIFHLEEGTIFGTNTFIPRGTDRRTRLPQADNVRRGPGGGNHFANFIAAVRSRRQEDLNADILDGHLSSALCHLGNISYRLGEQVPFNPRTGVFQGNEAATETLARMEEHLRDNSIRLNDVTCRVGPRLQFNAEEERFTNNDAANRMLTREYREGFTLPRNGQG